MYSQPRVEQMLSTICLLVLTLSVCADMTSSHFDDTLSFRNENNKAVGVAREKRAYINFAQLGIETVRKLLVGAKPAFSSGKKYRIYEKEGDLKTALKDFYSVQPVKVTTTTNSQQVTLLKGKSGDRSLSLQTTSFKGVPILDIIDYNSMKSGGRYIDRIMYKTADFKKNERNPINNID